MVCVTDATFSPKLTTTPDEVIEHITPDLKVRCDLNSDNTSTINIPLKLTIKKSSIRSPLNFTEIAYVNSIEHKLQSAFSVNGTITGDLKVSGTGSYIAVQWVYPQFDLTGTYICDLTGFDQLGQIVSTTSNVTVTDHKPNQVDALIKLQKHDLRLKALEKSSLALNAFANSLFMINTTFNNTKYLVSRPFLQNTAMAESVCALFGGYLAEFDGYEYVGIKAILVQQTSPTTGQHVNGSVLIGVTDEFAEGDFRFRSHPKTQTPSYNLWGVSPQQPDGGRGENCVTLVPQDDWRMYDVPCYDNTAYVHFMCEVHDA